MRLTPSAVARAAQARGLEVAKPPSLRTEEPQKMLRALAPDVMVVAAYGLILPQAVLDIPAHGCQNIHASLLPRWRGAAPVQRALLAGDEVTGICIMQMDAGLDTGPVLLRRELPIGARATSGELTEALATLGAGAVVDSLRRLGSLTPEAQPADGVTYAAKISKAEARIDWTLPADAIERRIRAFNPVPGAEGMLDGQALKIWRAEVGSGQGKPGEILAAGDAGIVIACGNGAIRALELQRSGARRMPAGEFLRGTPVERGKRLEVAGT
jgi:methionyl-tRNA formyltransferase